SRRNNRPARRAPAHASARPVPPPPRARREAAERPATAGERRGPRERFRVSDPSAERLDSQSDPFLHRAAPAPKGRRSLAAAESESQGSHVHAGFQLRAFFPKSFAAGPKPLFGNPGRDILESTEAPP